MPTRYCSLEEFATRLRDRSNSHAGDASSDCHSLSQREINLLGEQLARELDLWIPFSSIPQLGMPAPSGVENDVYLDASTGTMVKVNNLLVSKDLLSFFDRMLLHNQMFPQTKYTLCGFTGFGNGSIYPVMSQDYVPNCTYATHGQILDYMESLGFRQVGEATFSNGDITVSDLRPRNVLCNQNGNIFVIDADFHHSS